MLYEVPLERVSEKLRGIGEGFQTLGDAMQPLSTAMIGLGTVAGKTAMDFGLGASPDSWDSLLTTMLQRGYSKRELLDAGLAVQNDKGRIYDKFRNRLMLQVIDLRGDVIGFTSRVMDDSTPKYLNTPETSIFKKRPFWQN